jgi:hypothetical protein
MMRDAGSPCRLVVVGQKAWSYEAEFALVERLTLGDLVSYLGYVAEDDLPALYSGATAFAFPSLYEGFGLPVIEAMACGTPVLTSNLSATAEVAGDAAVLVDPLSVEEIRDEFARLLNEPSLREELTAKGLARYGVQLAACRGRDSCGVRTRRAARWHRRMSADTSIVIVTYNSRAVVSRPRLAPRAHSTRGRRRDNASPDGTADMIERDYRWSEPSAAGRTAGSRQRSTTAWRPPPVRTSCSSIRMYASNRTCSRHWRAIWPNMRMQASSRRNC